MQNNAQSNMQREDEINENYELVEERETIVYISLIISHCINDKTVHIYCLIFMCLNY